MCGGEKQPESFDFSNAVVASGSTVTFEIAVASDPSSLGYAFYDTGDGTACPDITQTNGTSPPLDSIRRNTVGVEIYAVSGNQTIYSVTATVGAGNGTVTCDPASVSPGESSTCTAVPDADWQVSSWTGACAAAGREHLLAHRVVDHALLQHPLVFQGDGHGELGETVQVVGGTVQGVYDPLVIVACVAAALLRQNGVVGVVLADDLDDRFHPAIFFFF